MDKIFVENITHTGSHGVNAEERSKAQEFRIDVCAEITSPISYGDDLANTADYREFLEAGRAVIEGPSVTLIETLAERIAESVLKNQKIGRVTVTVRKSRLSSGATIVRER